MKLTCMRGYPGSGKSTTARALPGVVVCRDDLRMQLSGTLSVGPDGEKAVTVAERAMVKALLADGRDVIVDAMHINPRYLKYWAKVAREAGAKFHVVDMTTPVEECIRRDLIRPDKHVGATVIESMAKRFPMERWPKIKADHDIVVEHYRPVAGTPKAIIVDIDGTLAINDGHRSFYDYSKVSEDKVDKTIRDLVIREWENGTAIVVCTGRDGDCRRETELWLYDNHVPVEKLLMRPSAAKDHHGNKLPDWIVKLDLFDKHIRDHYDVQYVLDDRNQVVRLWRRLGLKCLQVADGDF